MLPLSSPLNAGLQSDDISLALVLCGFSAFALGASDIARRLSPDPRRQSNPVTATCYGMLVLVGLALALMVCGIRGIPAAQAAFLAIAIWGLARAFVSVPRLWQWANSARRAELMKVTVIGAAMFWTLVVWTDLFQAHVALPVANDGIVHTALYLRILESGMPTLGRVPIGFADVFGTQFFAFYPTGPHSLMAIGAGFWGQWHVMTQAGVLKACFTLTLAALPWALYWFIRRLLPRMPWWIALAAALAAIPGFRFPIEAAHEGGASRLIAHLIFLPIYADTLLGRFDGFRSRAFAALLIGAAFLMHPSVCVALASLLALSAIASAIARSRSPFELFGGLFCAAIAGGALVAAILSWNHAEAQIHEVSTRFSWLTLIGRWHEGGRMLFERDYGMAGVMPWLIALGLITLGPSRLALGAPRQVVAYPIWMTMIGLVVLAAQVTSFPGSRLLGSSFYDETPRVIELLYEPIGLLLAAAIWTLSSAMTRVAPARGGHALIAALFISAALAYQLSREEWMHRHFSYWDRQFQTARIGRLDALGSWIETHTEPDAVLFYRPFDAEIWEAWTGRRGIFMYGECHANNALAPCLARKAFVADELAVLNHHVQHPTPDHRCLAGIDAFHRPAYFLMPSAAAAGQAISICQDAEVVISLDQHVVVRYQKPAQ